MTPQILLDSLRKAFLTLDTVRLLIFDECHHATGNHPYTRIMKVLLKHPRSYIVMNFFSLFGTNIILYFFFDIGILS